MNTQYSALMINRVSDKYDDLDPINYNLTAMASWKIGLDRAANLNFAIVVKDGVIIDAVTVYGANLVPSRYPDERNSDRVQLVASLQIPEWLEGLIGTKYEFTSTRNPVQYAYLNTVTAPIGSAMRETLVSLVNQK